MKRFEWTILQLGRVRMDTILQAIKETIFLNILIFNSISPDPQGSIDELFLKENKSRVTT